MKSKSSSLVSFTKKLIDYAGLFPPAKLPLKEAFLDYLKYSGGEHNFMLSKFICPANELHGLLDLIKENNADKFLIHISVILSGGNTIENFKENLESDLKLWNYFNQNTAGNIKINSAEVRLPAELNSQDSKNISSFVDYLSAKIKKQINLNAFVFLEGSSSGKWKENFSSLINGIELHNLNEFNSGFKLRTGGSEAPAFPTSEQIAFCIRECINRKVPMKFTAGLHHPFRHFDNNIGTKIHGFINVFGAGIIAMRHDISNTGIEEILNDENHANFIFTDDYFSWKDWNIEIADIEYARENLVLSFGSCSFDEPVDDLKNLGLL